MRFEKLGEIAKIIAGQSPPSSSYNSDGKGVPFFQGKADYGEKYPTVRYWCTEPTKISYPEDILISMRAPVGPVNINIVESCIGRGLSAIRVNENVSRDYIYFWLKQNQHIIASKETGSTFKAITQKILNEIVVPFPSYPEQQHIANLLSKAETLITQRKESLRLLDEYLKSTFLEMFGDPVRNEKGWDRHTGNDFLSKLTVGVVIKPASYYVENGIIALRSLNIRPNRIQLDNLVYFSKTNHENELSKSILREGDVVFVRTGMTGTAAIIPKELDGCNCIDLIVTRPKFGVINPQYLVFFFNSDIGKRIVSAKEIGGIQKHFNIGALRNLEIPIPPIHPQTQFAQIVEKTEALKTQYQQSLEELENLYNTLSQKAFRGELCS